MTVNLDVVDLLAVEALRPFLDDVEPAAPDGNLAIGTFSLRSLQNLERPRFDLAGNGIERVIEVDQHIRIILRRCESDSVGAAFLIRLNRGIEAAPRLRIG